MCAKKKNPLIILAFSNFLSVPHSPSHHFSTHPIISSKYVISRGNNVIFTTNLTSEIFLIFFSCEFSESYYREHSPWPVKIFPDKSAPDYLCTKVSPGSCLVLHISRSDGDQNYIYLHADEAESEGQGSKGRRGIAYSYSKDKHGAEISGYRAGSEEWKREKPVHIFQLKQQTSRAPLSSVETHLSAASGCGSLSTTVAMGHETREEGTLARCPFPSWGLLNWGDVALS